MAATILWCDNNNARMDGAAAHLDGVRTGMGGGPPPMWQLGEQRAGAVQRPGHIYPGADALAYLYNRSSPCRNHTSCRQIYVHMETAAP